MNGFLSFLSDDQGVSAVEYCVLIALIVVFCVTAITAIGDAAYDALWDAADALQQTP